jgi:predicted O-methyltransferase YrrM
MRIAALAVCLTACVGCGPKADYAYDESAAAAPATPAAKSEPAPPPPEPPPVLRVDEEKKVLGILADMRKNQSRGMMNVPEDDGRLLRTLTAAACAKHVVEIGTSNGYSGIWICLALKGTGGKLTTYEIDARRASLARENFKRAGVERLVTLVEGDAHKEIMKLEGPIDMVFLDADKGGYMDYLRKLLPKVRVGGMILAHNTRSHKGGMKEIPRGRHDESRPRDAVPSREGRGRRRDDQEARGRAGGGREGGVALRRPATRVCGARQGT